MSQPGQVMIARQMPPRQITPFEIEYFNINGRVCQLRCVAFYCSAPHINKRITFPEFGEGKKAGKYKFGSVPVINLKNGT